MASSANGLELQEMAEESGQKPKQPETIKTQIQAPVASTSFDISLSSERNLESLAEEDSHRDEESQPEKIETQIQPTSASIFFDDVSLSSERNLESLAEEDSHRDEESQPQASERLIQRYFKPTFVSDILSNKPAVDGFTNKSKKSDKKWIEENIKLRNSKDEEPSKPCNAFGEIHFWGYYQENATFVRVDHQTPMEIMMCLVRSTWNIRLPSLLISVIGGRKEIQLNPHTEAVGRGLYKAARTIDAWIITEGLHTGVAKYIGEVMHNKENKVAAMNEVTTLGIAPWNCVLEKKSLVNKEGSWPADYSIQTNSKEEKYALDPNHSHFILVDDGTKDNFGEIIEFRKKLEHTISQEKIPEQENVKIPAVVVLVGGGLETMKSVLDSISHNIPVITVKGCGPAADFMAFANQTEFENVDEDDGKLKADIREKIIKEYENELEGNVIDNMIDYVLEFLKRPNLITVYDTDSVEDFDLAIFKAVFKAQKNNLENLRLAFVWDRSYIVKRLIFEETQQKEDDMDTSEEARSVYEKRINSCDEFGMVKFEKGDQKIAKIDYMNHQTPMEAIIHLLMHRWLISSLPSLLISVIGGREDVQLNPFTKQALGRGLVNAARDNDVWIISEGLHTGVAKCVGEAINDYTSSSNCHTIGIAERIYVKDKKLRRSQFVENSRRDGPNTELYDLDPNHSHFILVDNGTPYEFRRMFEDTIAEMNIPETKVKIPAVAVMVGGGPGTLKSVYDSVSRNILVVVVKDSGRAADIMADAYQTKLENSNEKDEDINDRNLKTDIREKIIKEFEKELKGKGIDNLVDYVLMSLKQPNLLTIYDKDSEKEFDLTMFKAVFEAKNNIENMRLGLEWNKPDVLKRLIFKGEAHWEDVKKWIQENIKLRNLRDEEASNPCDAFGEVKFVEHDQKIAKFVRVDHQTPMDIIINLIIYQWDFSLPNLLISVIGGREDVQLNEPTKEALGHSLVKAARTTDAWIISEGLHRGAVKYIGEAISDNENKVADMKTVKIIGIAPWNCVQNKESLVNKEGLWPANYSNGGEYALDPNHTHFILVDDGTSDTSGVELEFKKQLEDTILQIRYRQKTTIPAVVVMVGQELETLKSAYDSLSRNIPVIIVKGSGKAADIMADAYEALLKKDEEGKDITERFFPRSILKQLKADIEKKWGANDVHDLVDCVFDSMRHLDLITVCNIQSPEDFDVAIMKAVFKGRKELKEVTLTSKRKRIDSLLNNVFSDRTQWQCGRRKKNNESLDIFWRKIDIKKWMQENIKLRNATDKELSKPCDAFGEVKFPEDGWNIAKFVRVDHQISMEITINLIKRLWYSSLPNLLISVIGERQDFQLDPFAREALGRGLVKAAQITGAWIISDGLHTGVAKHIGKAIHDNEAAMTGKKKVVTIGIASWNCVQNKESLVNEEVNFCLSYFPYF
ncbi:uncharacterized protein LOC115221043 [Octopus sinensis]|uniref:Uncharacterized protein LOC115221043 n=1 Tax=Octopus sinensis TaxID=2607531 RepID=A0A7E6FES0_9MOLL|nr:uncharacterized protein LOC115221043 [Octopus sinensis]